MKIRKITVLALSLMMVLTMSASVFAADPVTNAGTTVYLTKEFKVPAGIDVPEDAFKFTATPVFDNSETDLVSENDYPALTFGNIAFSDSDRVDAEDTTLVKTSGVDLATLSYPRAGLYKWTVTEAALDGTNKDKIVKGDETYTLRVYVKNGTNGTEIDKITVETPGGDKVNAGTEDQDNSTDTDGDDDATNDGNGFRFVNKYSVSVTEHEEPVNPNPDPDPENPENPGSINEDDVTTASGAFELDKFVLGAYGDQKRKFEFSVTVVLPATEKDFNLPEGWTDGVAKTVELAHGEDLTFAKLPAGTKITVAEAAVDHYTPVWTTSESNDGLEVLVGEKGGYAICRNSFNDSEVTPTGIVINNLPYILLIGLALGGIILFTRKRRYE